MTGDYRELGQNLLATTGVTLHYSAQVNTHKTYAGLSRGDTKFVDVPLTDPEAETFTHYRRGPSAVEADISYYNACAWGEETRTFGEQSALVRGRFFANRAPTSIAGSVGASILHWWWAFALYVDIRSGAIRATDGLVAASPTEKDGWETPLNYYIERTGLDRKQVLREILAFVNELPENHAARVAVLGTNIKELIHADN